MEPSDPATSRRRAFAAAGKALLVVLLVGALFVWVGRREVERRAKASLDAGVIATSFAEIKRVIDTEQKPVLLFVYASWCPYCRQDMPLIEDLIRDRSDRLRVLAVSIDGEPEKLGRYLREEKSNVEPLNIAGPNDRADLDARFGEYGLHFGGQIPYLAAFRHGRAVFESHGVLEKQVFDDMVADLENTGVPAPTTE